MNISKFNSKSLFFFLLLIAAALKDDFGSISTSEYWSELSIHPGISFIKSLSSILLITSGIIGLYIILGNKHTNLRVSTSSTFLIILTIITTLIATYFDIELAFKLFQTSAINTFIILVGGNIKSNQELFDSFYLFSTTFIIFNTINAALGYGFVPYNTRFFGTTIHPNFIGTQLAICNITFTARIICASSAHLYKHIATLMLLTCGILLQLLTGSRTALLMLTWGISTLWLSKNKFRANIFTALALLALFGSFLFVVINSDVDSTFYRGEGGSNTRSEVWISMLHLITDRPWLGYGYFIEYSENSYLRSMIAFGIPFGIALSIATIFCAVILFSQSWINKQIPDKAEHFFFTLMSSLLIGGIFEGFLIDSWSLPKLTFILLTIATLPSTQHRFLHRSHNNLY